MIKIGIIEDQLIYSEELEGTLKQVKDFEIVFNNDKGKEGLFNAMQYQPDILILDQSLPDISGIEIADKIKCTYENIKVIALDNYFDPEHEKELNRVKVDGIVPKNIDKKDLIDYIKRIYEGERIIWSEEHEKPLAIDQEDELPVNYTLSKKENEIIRMIAQGTKTDKIAKTLNLSEQTVRDHRRNILTKTKSGNDDDLMTFASKYGLI